MKTSLGIVRTGFTLIEILLVMAILGIIAGITLVALNPLEQISKTNDSKTKQSVNQLGGLVTAFYAQKQVFPVADSDWMDELISNADLGERPAAAPAACAPSSGNDSNFCLQTNASSATVYARLNSQVEDKKCSVATEVPYFAYVVSRGNSCIVCASVNATLTPTETCDASQ